jgi:hypothetical protein
MEIIALSITALFVGYMLWAVGTFVFESWKFNEVAQGLVRIPIWIPQMSFVLVCPDFFYSGLDELVIVVHGAKPTYQLAQEARRAAGRLFRDGMTATSAIDASGRSLSCRL